MKIVEFARRRPSIIAGIVGAIIALAALIGWPDQGYLVIHLALAWLSLLFTMLAMLTITVATTRARAVIAMAVGLGGFVFWLAFPPSSGPVAFEWYLLTAAVHLGLGFLVPPQDPRSQRSVLIACAGVAVFVILGVMTRQGM